MEKYRSPCYIRSSFISILCTFNLFDGQDLIPEFTYEKKLSVKTKHFTALLSVAVNVLRLSEESILL